MKDDILLNALRTKYQDADTTGFTVFDFIFAFGSPVEAAGYARLFWPNFIEWNCMILRSDIIEDSSDMARLSEALANGIGRNAIEKRFNSVEIPSGLFGRQSGESNDLVNEYLATTLVDMWRSRLEFLFPGRCVDVELMHGSDDIHERVITISQQKNP